MNKHINTSGFFLIENILSKHECDTYINDINILFDKNPDPEGLLYDKYNRVRINNQIMSEFIVVKFINILIVLNIIYITNGFQQNILTEEDWRHIPTEPFMTMEISVVIQ